MLICGAVFDGVSDEITGRAEILVSDGLISAIGPSVQRPDGAEVIDLSERTVSPGFIGLAREYLSYGFTTLRDLGSMDPEFPTVDLRNALDAGLGRHLGRRGAPRSQRHRGAEERGVRGHSRDAREPRRGHSCHHRGRFRHASRRTASSTRRRPRQP